jgi:hypothetical protein
MIEIMEVADKDYLQVFELSETTSDEKPMQQIIHKQEQPLYQKTHIIPIKTTVTAKVFVVDDGSHSTIILAHEY